MVINQTTNRGGNMNLTENPTRIYLVSPKRALGKRGHHTGRHLIVPGNLAHGVPGQLVPLAEGAVAFRTTGAVAFPANIPAEHLDIYTIACHALTKFAGPS